MEWFDWVGLGAMYVNACNFIISKYIKNYNSVQVITEPQSSRNFLLDIKKKISISEISFFLF